MEREILTYPIEKAQVHGELAYFVGYFSKKSVQTCEVLFGFAWGIEYYPGNEWPYEHVKLSHLTERIDEVEKTGIGSVR
jgi:phosphomevalonate kinase